MFCKTRVAETLFSVSPKSSEASNAALNFRTKISISGKLPAGNLACVASNGECNLIPVHKLLWYELTASEDAQRVPEPALMTDAQQVRDYLKVTNWLGPNNANFYMHIRRLAEHIREGGTVLELACGPAVILRELATLFPGTKFIGVDLSPTMLTVAQEEAERKGLQNIQFLEQDICQLESVADRSVDLVFCTLALHHLPSENHLQNCFAQISRLLKSDGRYYLHDFCLLKSDRSRRTLVESVSHQISTIVYDDYLFSLKAAFSIKVLSGAAQALLPSPCSLEVNWGAQVLMTIHNLPNKAGPFFRLPHSVKNFLQMRWRSFSFSNKLEYFLSTRFIRRHQLSSKNRN